MQFTPPPDTLAAVGLSGEFRQRYEFDWEVLDVIIGGRSAIDSAGGLRIRTPEEATKFLDCYGYNLENPIESAELFGNFQESLSFIRRYFLQPENPEGAKLEVPRKIAELTDMQQLLLLASPGTAPSSGQSSLSSWACAVIKVMHTISHMDKDLRSHYFSDIQTQILDRFYKFIHRDEKGQIFLGQNARDAERVEVIHFDSKPKKSRDSVILKLLHKPENVAEDIFDRVGIRFVTRNRFDALRIVKFLRDRYVIMAANVKPSRSRNTLVNAGAFRGEVEKLIEEVDAGRLTASDLDRRLVDFCEGTDTGGDEDDNPHSSRHYRAIQFTSRQLIKFRNSLYDDIKALKSAMKGTAVPEEVAKIADRLDLRNLQKEIRFFYPFEVQIYDEKSHEENLAGRSSHSSYKKSQIQAAMRRVLGHLSTGRAETAARHAQD